MNKRIELLLVKAIQESNSAVKNETYEKFAELIIRECVSKIGDEYKDALDDVMEDWDRGFLGGLSCAMDTVQKHFGVGNERTN